MLADLPIENQRRRTRQWRRVGQFVGTVLNRHHSKACCQNRCARRSSVNTRPFMSLPVAITGEIRQLDSGYSRET
ncbi:hypothetical protein GIV53_14685, partial [Pseudomonas syringae]|nr:hypothetical protein [Pseudomonas syringae]